MLITDEADWLLALTRSIGRARIAKSLTSLQLGLGEGGRGTFEILLRFPKLSRGVA
jgi:hypothetical protein